MKLIDWLTRAAPATTDPAPDIPNAVPRIPPEDDPESSAPEMFREADGSIPIDEVFAAIEYQDSRGNVSRRRITMLKLVPGPRGLQLQAICHERKAFRCFRVDRIGAFINFDGEVLEPEGYWKGIGIDIGQVDGAPCPASAHQLCSALRSPLSVLVTLSRCDRSMHPDEVLAVLTYAADEALSLGVPCDDVTVEQMASIIRAMRPQRETIKDHFLAVLELDDRRQRRFVQAVREVILADGRIEREEANLAEKLERWTAELIDGDEIEDPVIAAFFDDRLTRVDHTIR